MGEDDTETGKTGSSTSPLGKMQEASARKAEEFARTSISKLRASEESVRQGVLSPEAKFTQELISHFTNFNWAKLDAERKGIDPKTSKEFMKIEVEWLKTLRAYKGDVRTTLGDKYEKFNETALKYGMSLEPPPQKETEQ